MSNRTPAREATRALGPFARRSRSRVPFRRWGPEWGRSDPLIRNPCCAAPRPLHGHCLITTIPSRRNPCHGSGAPDSLDHRRFESSTAGSTGGSTSTGGPHKAQGVRVVRDAPWPPTHQVDVVDETVVPTTAREMRCGLGTDRRPRPESIARPSGDGSTHGGVSGCRARGQSG